MEPEKLSLYICGSHCAGKTTLQHALQQDQKFAKFNFKSQEEIARSWIKSKGYSKSELRQPDSYFTFQKELLDLQILAEKNELNEFSGRYSRFLWDRGVMDIITYVKEFFGKDEAEKWKNMPEVKEIFERWKSGEEILVVVPTPEPEFNIADDARRESDMEELMKIHNSMIETLGELGVPHIVITVFDLSQRVKSVVEEVTKKWPWLAIS